jgi:protein arginine kinase activator
MQCEICGKAPATITYTEHREDKIKTLRLCQQCAEEKGLHLTLTSKKYPLAEPLAELAEGMMPGEKDELSSLCCRSCELPFSTFAATGRLGCPDCYVSFAAQLKPLLRKAHGSTSHTGKAPVKDGPELARKKEIRALYDALERAVEKERYEEAASIRDKIRELETDGGEAHKSEKKEGSQ